MAARTRILAALRESGSGLDTNALARAVGLHPNTVRWHLGVLGEQGLVQSAPVADGRRGRPSNLYRLTPAGFVQGRDEYHLLAAMLAGVVAESPGLKENAYASGRAGAATSTTSRAPPSRPTTGRRSSGSLSS